MHSVSVDRSNFKHFIQRSTDAGALLAKHFNNDSAILTRSRLRRSVSLIVVMSLNQPVCPVPFDGPPTSLAGLVEQFFRRCVEDLTRVNAPRESKCSSGLRDSLARVGIQLQGAPPISLDGCLVAQSNSVARIDGPDQQGTASRSNTGSEPTFPLWLCPGHIRPGQIIRFPTSPDLVYVDIDGQETIFFRNASNPCANQDQLCPNRERLGRLFDLPRSNSSQFSVYLHGCLSLADQRRCGYLDLRLPANNRREKFRLDSVQRGVTCPGAKVLLDNALQLFPITGGPPSMSTTPTVTSISTATTSQPSTSTPPSTLTRGDTASRGSTSTSLPPRTTTLPRSTTSATRSSDPPLPAPSPPGSPETEVTATVPPSASNGLVEGDSEGMSPSAIALIFLSIVAVLGMSIIIANFVKRKRKREAAAARRESVMSFSSGEAPTPPTLPPPLPALQHLNLDRKGSAGSDEILSGIPVPADQRITPVNLMRSIPSATYAGVNSTSMTMARQSVKTGFERVDGVEYIHISSLVTLDEIARAPDEPLQQIVDGFESIFMQLETHVRSEVVSDPSSPASGSNHRASHALEAVQALRDKRVERLIVATSSLLAKATGRPVVPGTIPDGLGARFLDILTKMAKYDKESILFTIDKGEQLCDHTRTARVYHIMGDVARPSLIAATVMPGWMQSDGDVLVAVRVAAASATSD